MTATPLAALEGYPEQRAAILALARDALASGGLFPTARELASRIGVKDGKATRLTAHLAKSGALGLMRVTVPNGHAGCISTRYQVVSVDESAPLPLRAARQRTCEAQVAWDLNALLAIVRLAHRNKSPMPTLAVMVKATGIPLSTIGARMLSLRRGRWFGLKKDVGPKRRKGVFVTWVKDGTP